MALFLYALPLSVLPRACKEHLGINSPIFQNIGFSSRKEENQTPREKGAMVWCVELYNSQLVLKCLTVGAWVV